MRNYFFNSFNLIAKLSRNFINFAIADRMKPRSRRRGREAVIALAVLAAQAASR